MTENKITIDVLKAIPSESIADVKSILNVRDEFQKEMDKFSELFRNLSNDDLKDIGRITQCHLIVEHYLMEMVRAFNPNLDKLDKLNLDFAKLLTMAISINHKANFLSAVQSEVWVLNDIRKDLVHRLNKRAVEHDKIAKLEKFLKTMDVAKTVEGNPIAVVELFTVIVVTFIQVGIILMRRLEAVEREALKAKIEKEALDGLGL